MRKNNIIKERREALGLTPEDVAAAADLPLTTYKRFEEAGAQINIYLHNIILLSRVLGLPVEAVADSIDD